MVPPITDDITPGPDRSVVGRCVVQLNEYGCYDIKHMDKTVRICIGIGTHDVAVTLAQRWAAGDMPMFQKLVSMEAEFTKYWNQTILYRHAYRSAKRKRDYVRMRAIEDKHLTAASRASRIRSSILAFRQV